MQFLNKSFFSRIIYTLIPFTFLVTGIYTFLVSTSHYATEDYILRQYLQAEYEQFILRYQVEGNTVPLPSTSYLQGYWQNDARLDKDLQKFGEGYHELESDHEDNDRHLLVAKVLGTDQHLVLVLKESQFSDISQHEELRNSLIIAIAGLVIFSGVIIAIMIARNLAQPVNALSRDISKGWQPGKQFYGSDREDEIGMLSRRFTDLTQALQQALDKEKAFSRHVSHEIRTPLAIVRNASAVLNLSDTMNDKQRRNLQRIDTACSHAERITEVFLNLGQDRSSFLQEHLALRPTIEACLSNYHEVISAKGIEVAFEGDDVSVQAPTAALTIVFDNLLRNALHYGEDRLTIALDTHQVTFTNPLSAGQSHGDRFGYGLEIVQRICTQLGWACDTHATADRFIATVQFPEA